MSFLQLPTPLRLRIYAEAGLGNHHWIDLDSKPKALSNPAAINILLSCKTIYREVMPIIYSSNTFMACCSDSGSLQPITQLNPSASCYLTNLVIHLKISVCKDTTGCDHLRVNAGKDSVLGRQSPSHRSILSGWNKAAATLSKGIMPGQLALHFACDTDDLLTAKEVAVSLLKLPTLKSGSLRLAHGRNRAIQELAFETLIQATGLSLTNRYSAAFPFNSLPKELKLYILQFTNLVAPHKLRWNQRMNGLVSGLIFSGCCENRHGCFCPTYHAAFSIPDNCNCWEFPRELFTVNRAFYIDSLEVFYSKNRFTLDPSGRAFERDPYAGGWFTATRETLPRKLPAWTFLREVVPKPALCHLRSLELAFPILLDDDISPSSAGFQVWESTISFLAEHTILPRLTLKIILTRDDYVTGSTREETKDFLKRYKTILMPLKRLKGLKDLFIALEYPHRYRGYYEYSLLSPEARAARALSVKKLELSAEKMIMGSGYDSLSRGKNEWKPWD